jgi:hypothetical protein
MVVDFNRRSIDDIDEDKQYNILVEVDGTKSNSGKGPNEQIMFTDADGNRYNIAVWDEAQTHLAQGLEVGNRYRFTNIWYSTRTKNGRTYHNLRVKDSTNVEEIEDISQQLNKAQTNPPVPSKSDHIITTFKSTEPVPFKNLYKTEIVLRSDVEGTQRQQVYSARRELYSKTDIEAVAVDSNDMVVYTVDPLDSLETEKFKFETVESVSFELSNSGDRRLVESIIEEGMKNSLREDYNVRGIDEVLSKNPVCETDKFAMHERYDISITVGENEYIYIDVYFKHRLVSNLYVSDLDSVYSGLRVKKAYGNRSAYRVSKSRNKGTCEKIPEIGNRSVYEYFDGRDFLSPYMLEKIKKSSNSILDVKPRKSYATEATVFPQEVLVVEPSVNQIERFDSDFMSMYNKNRSVSSSKYWSKISSFVQDNSKFEFSGYNIKFDDSPLTNSNKKKLKKLYDRDAKVLRFGSGVKGHRPNDVFEYEAAEPVNGYKVGVICPEQSKDNIQNLIEMLSDILSSIDCTPHIAKWLTYNPVETNIDELEMKIRKNIDRELDCAVVNVLDMTRIPGCDYGDGEEQYNRIKSTLGEKGIPSQMIDIDTVRGDIRDPTIKNIALGLLACTGGIPFTPDKAIPGKADMFLGIDVATRFDGGANNKISVAATSVAVMSDGTILGRNTQQPQRGETVSDETLRNSVMSAIIGYEKKVGEKPEHIVIHRDGFLYESLDNIKVLLDNFNISYDMVEIRKQPQARILKWENKTAKIPDKGIAMIDEENNSSVLSTWGAPESQATSKYTGIPRPIQVSKKEGDTDIETLTKQVYLLAQAHIGVSNTTIRLPITTAYADKAGEAAINGWLVESDDNLSTQLGFL